MLEYDWPAEMKYLLHWSEVFNKAAWYTKTQGDYLAAEEMNRRAMEGYEKALGEEHADTLTSVSDLAEVLHAQGKGLREDLE